MFLWTSRLPNVSKSNWFVREIKKMQLDQNETYREVYEYKERNERDFK